MSQRSYTNLSQQNKTFGACYKVQHERIVSDDKRQVASDDRSKTQHHVPKGILQLRKQMLNQEYEALEEQKRQMQIEDFSPESAHSYFNSEFETPRDIADEYSVSGRSGKLYPNNTRTPI